MTQIFSQEQLSKIISETLPSDAKPGEKIVIGTVDRQGAQIVASFKLMASHGMSWQLMAAARHNWDGTDEYGTKILLRWD